MSVRQQILAAIQARLQAIQIANGFQTDAGSLVFLGESPQLGTDDPIAAVAIVPQDAQFGANRVETWSIEIQGLTKADLDQPYVAIEAIVADIQKAMELDDRSLGGLVKYVDGGSIRALPRDPGATTVGAGVFYTFTRIRVWGQS